MTLLHNTIQETHTLYCRTDPDHGHHPVRLHRENDLLGLLDLLDLLLARLENLNGAGSSERIRTKMKRGRESTEGMPYP